MFRSRRERSETAELGKAALKSREAMKGAGDEIPGRVWAAAQRNPNAADRNRRGAEGDGFDSGKAA